MSEVILSLDMSTTCTGWAVFNENRELLKYGALKPDNLKDDWRNRVMNMSLKLLDIIREINPSKIIAEDVPTFVRKNNSNGAGGMKQILILGTIQGVLLSICEIYYNGKIVPEFIPVSDWRKKFNFKDGTREGTKRENLKMKSIETANEIFSLDLFFNYEHPTSKYNEDDISDAILIGYSTFLEEEKLIKK